MQNENFNLKKYLKDIVKSQVDMFHTLTEWKDGDYERFGELLQELEKPFDKKEESTKSKGDRLENLVEFIIKKTYFFNVYRNIHTGTNEVDDIIVLSEEGKQALYLLGISKDLLEVEGDIFIGECKNYENELGVTYIGKFYSLMITTGTTFGIIFTKNGVTGKPAEYHDSHGLMKVIHLIEKYQSNRKFYMLEFSLEDYKKIYRREADFFSLLKAKKLSIDMSCEYDKIIDQNRHEKEKDIKKAINEYKKGS